MGWEGSLDEDLRECEGVGGVERGGEGVCANVLRDRNDSLESRVSRGSFGRVYS